MQDMRVKTRTELAERAVDWARRDLRSGDVTERTRQLAALDVPRSELLARVEVIDPTPVVMLCDQCRTVVDATVEFPGIADSSILGRYGRLCLGCLRKAVALLDVPRKPRPDPVELLRRLRSAIFQEVPRSEAMRIGRDADDFLTLLDAEEKTDMTADQPDAPDVERPADQPGCPQGVTVRHLCDAETCKERFDHFTRVGEAWAAAKPLAHLPLTAVVVEELKAASDALDGIEPTRSAVVRPNRKMETKTRFTIPAGSSPWQAAEAMLELARRRQETVTAAFNGTELVAKDGMRVQHVLEPLWRSAWPRELGLSELPPSVGGGLRDGRAPQVLEPVERPIEIRRCGATVGRAAGYRDLDPLGRFSPNRPPPERRILAAPAAPLRIQLVDVVFDSDTPDAVFIGSFDVFEGARIWGEAMAMKYDGDAGPRDGKWRARWVEFDATWVKARREEPT